MFRINRQLQHSGYDKTDSPFQRMRPPQIVSNMSTSTSKGVELSVSPLSCLHDEAVSIKVKGLAPHQDVTLQASMKDNRGVHFMALAHYRADNAGKVDVDVMESLGGHYKGVFPMGLLGSLLPAPSEYKYIRFFKRDVQNPNLVTMSVHDGHLSAESLCSPDAGEPLMFVSHERHYMAPGVQRIPVRYGKVRGCLFLPPGDGPFPGVIDMFGTAGGLLEYRAAQLASRGFASLALGIFNYEGLPMIVKSFNMAYFEEAVEFLLKHDKVHSSGVGIVGNSKGGDLALSMAAFIPSIVACVAINCCCAPLDQGMQVEDHYYPPVPPREMARMTLSDDGVINIKYANVVDRALLSKLILPIEQSRAAFLFLVSADDQDMNSDLYAHMLCRRLSDYNYSNGFETVAYQGVGHLVDPPYSAHSRASFQHNAMAPILWGGNAKFTTMGQEEAWKKLQGFLWLHIVEKGESSIVNKAKLHINSQL